MTVSRAGNSGSTLAKQQTALLTGRERLLDPRMQNILPDWLSGRPNYWWFSDAAIEEHAVSELVLMPPLDPQ